MLIENLAAHRLAEEQSSIGLELAFQANNALRSADRITAARDAELARDQHCADWHERIYLPQADARSEAVAYYENHRQLVNAAGALIGRYTLGGEFLSVKNGKAPTLYSDGSYIAGSAN